MTPEDEPRGFLNVSKPAGMSSHGVVSRVRRLIGVRRVGHAGTLDPLAVGVLPIAVGVATRLTMASGWSRKRYWADIKFGAATTTDDGAGEIVETGDPSALDLDRLTAALGHFVGPIQQYPPIYSAVHIDGERAYARARRGQDVVVEARWAQIDGIRVVGWERPVLSILIDCRSGTYIRSLARDLGRQMGCPAHLDALVRLRVGPFLLHEAQTLEEIEQATASGQWTERLWPADVAVEDLPALVLTETSAEDFCHGRAIERTVEGGLGRVRTYATDGRFLGLAEEREGVWKPAVVLEQPR
jgi:tRNA pseudouridine55 synthase